MKTLNILAFLTIVSSPLFAKEVKEVNSTTPIPVTVTGHSAQSPTWTQDTSNKHNPNLINAFAIQNQALFDSWLYFPEIGWIYLTSDAFPWAYVASSDLQIFAWVFVDTNNDGFAFYHASAKKWFELK
jgi:hypothetical protein